MRVTANYRIASPSEEDLQNYRTELITDSLFYRFADECKKVLTVHQIEEFTGQFTKSWTVQGIVLSAETYRKITELLKTQLTFDQYMKVLCLLTTE